MIVTVSVVHESEPVKARHFSHIDAVVLDLGMLQLVVSSHQARTAAAELVKAADALDAAHALVQV